MRTRCKFCQKKLTAFRRSNRVYCDFKCRKNAYGVRYRLKKKEKKNEVLPIV